MKMSCWSRTSSILNTEGVQFIRQYLCLYAMWALVIAQWSVPVKAPVRGCCRLLRGRVCAARGVSGDCSAPVKALAIDGFSGLAGLALAWCGIRGTDYGVAA